MTRPLALVTGGHRRLGAAIARALAAAGYDVAIHGSQDADPETGLAKAFEAAGAQWAGFAADFSDADSPARLMKAVTEHFGRAPDLLVNSASIFGQDRLADSILPVPVLKIVQPGGK
ncbi:SDR family NAD(P)-dependent oxidoreductase [Escherichia coli]|uniref:SDR family NAD(P)-dependent oxidoreductase n=1 Tax=Escherichia coli TaxID=562 RepID=UPI00190A16CF|nr:SDR family NAD(P)-dependent oxidoreductase [Escherichia coli]